MDDVSATLQAKDQGGYSLNYQTLGIYSRGYHGAMCEGVGTLKACSMRKSLDIIVAQKTCGAFHTLQDPISGEVAPCMGAQGGGTIGVFMAGQSPTAGSTAYSESASPTLRAASSGTNQTPAAVYCAGNGQANNATIQQTANTLDTMHDAQIIVGENPEANRKYIVRRLTPTECGRLQGFPDWWEDGVQGSDSARYKMWGNGIALPCAHDVVGRVALAIRCPEKPRAGALQLAVQKDGQLPGQIGMFDEK